MMKHHTDEELIKMAKQDNTEAFEGLFERYKSPILNFVYRLLGNRETAEEVTQEVFVKVYKNLDSFDSEKRFSPWLYTIARNLTKNAIRDRKYFRDISIEKNLESGNGSLRLKDVLADSNVRPDEVAENKEFEKDVQRVLNSLPLEYREIIALCSIQGLSYKEAAGIVKCSIATISLKLKKAKKLFMKQLGLSEQ